jgi:hypothetical protein
MRQSLIAVLAVAVLLPSPNLRAGDDPQFDEVGTLVLKLRDASASAREREMAARRLGLLGDKAEAAIPALLDCLTGQAPPNREALRALHRIPFTTADEFRRLVAALRTTALARNRDRTRDGLIDLFRLLGSKAQAVAPELASGLGEDPRQSLAFAFALAAVGGERAAQAVPYLADGLLLAQQLPAQFGVQVQSVGVEGYELLAGLGQAALPAAPAMLRVAFLPHSQKASWNDRRHVETARAKAVEVLVAIGARATPAVIDYWRRHPESASARDLRNVIRGYGVAAAPPLIDAALDSKDEALAEVAGSHLAVLGRPTSKALLARLPGSEEKGSRARKRRERVLTLLARFDEVDAEALEFAAKYAAHKRVDLRLAAFAVLRAIGAPARPLAGEIAAGLSEGADRPARMEFLASVAPLPADAKLAALSFMGDPDPTTRNAVATLLSKDPITTKAELDALARGIQSTSTPGVVATLHAIRSAGVRLEWKAPWLIDATKDEVPDVRKLGIDALGVLGAAEKDGRVVQPIASCLADRNEGVKLIAAGTLGTLGALAKPALPALRQCFQDESWRVREAALAAVKQIESALK